MDGKRQVEKAHEELKDIVKTMGWDEWEVVYHPDSCPFGEVSIGDRVGAWIDDDGEWRTADYVVYPGDRWEPPSGGIVNEKTHTHRCEAIVCLFQRIVRRDVMNIYELWAEKDALTPPNDKEGE